MQINKCNIPYYQNEKQKLIISTDVEKVFDKYPSSFNWMQSFKEQQGEMRKPSSVNNTKK